MMSIWWRVPNSRNYANFESSVEFGKLGVRTRLFIIKFLKTKILKINDTTR